MDTVISLLLDTLRNLLVKELNLFNTVRYSACYSTSIDYETLFYFIYL